MKLSHTFFLLPALALPFGATASERLHLQLPVQYSSSAGVMPRIKSECDLERQLAVDAETQINKRYGRIELAAKDDNVGNDKVLTLTIIDVSGIGGGQWTGPKSMTLRAELKQGETMLSTKVFSRASGQAGLFGGTCDMLHKVTRALGADVGVWLKRGPQASTAASEAAPGATE